MSYVNKTTLWESCVIQGRVLKALILREIITRYDRKNIGFMWLFVEPLIMTLLIAVLWGELRAYNFSNLNIIAFTITGYPLMMMWRNTANRSVGAIDANISLLYHRNVRVLDTILARMILEISGATIAQIVIMTTFVFLDIIPKPDDIFYMLMAWGSMSLFAVGLGLVVTAIANKFEAFGKIWSTLSFILMPLSGVFFFLNNIPGEYRSYLSWLPMIHGTEMFRHGYFGDHVTTLEDPFYLLFCNLVLLTLGFALIRLISRNVNP
ncbi:sugar ABC transporter permease [Psittacicella melopsittaci]|uniref:Transport permease protein n=1 Tax=Psittacicella melopsittaci TaxID=2028576 RepID=A0A3A1Y1L3_9GAMM|nr:ABC transporter permease [Psittacicella melopsittaci]RIY31310.1 sugar ABC transporter permease [Psittacicella melopsittaci]